MCVVCPYVPVCRCVYVRLCARAYYVWQGDEGGAEPDLDIELVCVTCIPAGVGTVSEPSGSLLL